MAMSNSKLLVDQPGKLPASAPLLFKAQGVLFLQGIGQVVMFG